MNYSAVFLFAIAILIIAYFGSIYLSRFKLIGTPNPSDDGDNNEKNWQIYYFHVPHCGACKSITPWVNEQQSAHPNVVSVDISQDVATARKFNIRATPTAVFLENNVISDVQLGAGIAATMKEFVAKHGSIN